MSGEVDFKKIKEGFYFVTSPEVRGHPWYLRQVHGKGTYAEIANDPEVGVYIAPWPFNKHMVVEEHGEPDLRKIWDGSPVFKVIERAYREITKQLAEDESP
jgi:hypothetical protein